MPCMDGVNQSYMSQVRRWPKFEPKPEALVEPVLLHANLAANPSKYAQT